MATVASEACGYGLFLLGADCLIGWQQTHFICEYWITDIPGPIFSGNWDFMMKNSPSVFFQFGSWS